MNEVKHAEPAADRCSSTGQNGKPCPNEKGYAGDGLCYDHSSKKAERVKRGTNNKQRSKNYERTLASDLGVTRLDAIPGYAGQRRSDIRFKSQKLARTFDIEVKSRVRANLSELFKEAAEKCQFPNFPVLALILRKRKDQRLEKYAVLNWADFCDLIGAERDQE